MDKHTRAHLVEYVRKYYDPDDVVWAVGVMQDYVESLEPDDAEYWVDKQGWRALEDHLEREKLLGWDAVQKRPGKRDDPAQGTLFNARRRRARGARRRNPSLVAYLANPGQRAKIASDVQAVLYRHARDGKYYLHVFGNQGDGTVKRFRGGEYLRIDNLPTRTGVILERIGDNLLVRHNEGLPLARKF